MKTAQEPVQAPPVVETAAPEASPYTAAAPSSSMVVQRKLAVGASDDAYEREADRVAAEVVNRLMATPTLEQQPLVARRADPANVIGAEGGSVDGNTEARIQSARSSGKPLDESTRGSMESAMGADFGSVRIHEGSESNSLNRQLGAEAFTVGSDVFFRDGMPSGTDGTRLLAHELTHTVQQGAAVQRYSTGAASPQDEAKDGESGPAGTFERGGYTYLSNTGAGDGGGPAADGDAPANGYDYVVEGNADAQGDAPIDGYGYVVEGDADAQGDAPQALGGGYGSGYGPATMEEARANIDAQDAASSGGQALGGGYGSGYGMAKSLDELLGIQADDLAEADDIEGLEEEIEEDIPEEPKYSRLRSVDPRYSAESISGSPDLPGIIAMGLRMVASGQFRDMTQFMHEQFGWSAEDVEKYITQAQDSKVAYLNEDERTAYELHGGSSLKQGEATDAFDTSAMFSKHSGKGFGIYVMAADGTLYADQHKIGLFHHSSFLAGGDVAGAGEIKVIAGSVKIVTNKTGHYAAGDNELWQVLDELKSRGVNLDAVEVRNDYHRKSGWPGGTALKFWETKKP